MAKEFGSKVDQLLGNYSGTVETEKNNTSKKNHATVNGLKRAYYITPEQIQAIALKAATDGMSKSEVVQEALNQYLADYLDKGENQ